VFQQEGTVIRTWATKGKGTEVKSKPCRRSCKVLGALRLDAVNPTLHFRFEKDKFNADTFGHFVEHIVGYYVHRGERTHLILDGASYHKKTQDWALAHPDAIEFHFLPPYSPDLNLIEQLWRKTKASATHNRYFPTLESLHGAIFRRFNRYQGNPASLRSLVDGWI
jgi:hypothetical protein